MQGSGLTSDTSASTTFAVGLAGPLIYASAATGAATGETATARPTALGNFMGLVCCPRAARRLGAIASILVEPAARARPAQWTSGSDVADEIRNSLWTCILSVDYRIVRIACEGSCSR